MIQYIRRSVSGAAFLSLFIMVVLRTIYHYTVQSGYPWHMHLFSLFLILGAGLILSLLNDRYNLLPQRTQWIIVCYVWLVTCCPQTYDNVRAPAAALFAAAATYMLVYSAYVSMTRSGPFLCAFFITCAGLLYFPAYFLLIPFTIGFIRLAKVSVKDTLAFTGGIVVPLFLVSALFWFLDKDVEQYWKQTWEHFGGWDPAVTFSSFTIAQIVMAAVLTLLVLLSLFIRLVRRDTTTTVNISRFYGSIFWYMFFSAAVVILYPTYAPDYIPTLMIPVSILITSLFSERRLFGSKIWLTLLILSTLGHWFAFIFS